MELDSYQENVVFDNSNYLLVTAGAGSGKTFTILSKIKYLIDNNICTEDEILCLSFTRNASFNLESKLDNMGYFVPVYTFHKLSINILKENKVNFLIADDKLLDDVVHHFFSIDIYNSNYLLREVCFYFKIRCSSSIYRRFYFECNDSIVLLEKLCTKFIRMAKCNNYDLEDFPYFLKRIKTIFNFYYRREKSLLIIFVNIFIIYKRYLEENSEFDFDDLIINATDLIDRNGIIKNFKYIIIDEYQDTSYIRFRLIKEIINKTGARLMAVGDDYQSIYGFSGCDISLFLDFSSYFSDSKILHLVNTYRNSQELIDIAGTFIMKNPFQIKKKLYSFKHCNKPVKIIYYKNILDKFLNVIDEIYSDGSRCVFVLGRNNSDIKMLSGIKIDNNKLIIDKYNDMNIVFMTVHKSKGLEADSVIVINMIDCYLGFPNKIKDEKIMRLVSKKYDNYLFSEERRLFYVALTRSRNRVYLFSPLKNKSIFINEIKKLV